MENTCEQTSSYYMRASVCFSRTQQLRIVQSCVSREISLAPAAKFCNKYEYMYTRKRDGRENTERDGRRIWRETCTMTVT